MNKELTVEQKQLVWRAREDRLKRNQELEDVQIRYSRVTQFLDEYPQARQLQADLLEEVRELGLVSIVEDVTHMTIPLLSNDYEDYFLLEKSAAEESQLKETTGWGLFIPAPTLSNKYGIWCTDAKIYAFYGKYKQGKLADGSARGMLALSHCSERLVKTSGGGESTWYLKTREGYLERAKNIVLKSANSGGKKADNKVW